jgi:hypothetical protein
VNHRACTHEKQSLEKRMGDEVEHPHGHAAHAEACHHVAELRNSGVGEYSFDIVLRNRDKGGEECGRCAHPRDDSQRGCGADGLAGLRDLHAGLHQRIHASHKIHARGHHGCGVDQSRHRRRAFHRVRKPDMQWKLTALADRTCKYQERNPSGSRKTEMRWCRQQTRQIQCLHRAGTSAVEEQCPRLREKPNHAQQKEDVANTRCEEGFLGRCRSRWLLIPEADQQVGREAHEFPAHKEQQQTVGDDHAQHRPRKQTQEAEESGEIFIVGHVAGGVDKDKQAHKAHHHQHHC